MAKPWILCGVLPILAAGLIGADAAPDAHDFAQAIDLTAGAVLQINVEHTGARPGADGQTVSLKSGSHFKLQVTPTADGYRVHQLALVVDPTPGLPADQQQAVSAASAAGGDFEYETDEFLAPLRIADWPGYVSKMARASAALSLVTGADPVTVSQLQAMTPEQGAAGLVEAGFLALPQGMALDLGKPITGKDTSIDSAAGAAMIIDYSYELTALDKAAGRATIVTKEAFDPASASAAAQRTVTLLAPSQLRGVGPSPAELAALKIERTTECRYDMDLNTGLTLKADCTRTIGQIDVGLKIAVRTDRWVITQALASPGN